MQGTRPPALSVAGVSPLVGRAVELATLHDLLEAGAHGHGGLVLLSGEAGIGKSRLVQAVSTDAEAQGWCVVGGRAVETSTPSPYRPLAEALSSAVRRGLGPTPDEVGPFRATLGRLVPEWRLGTQSAAEESQVAVAEAVLRFLRGVARNRPALLVAEDVHWADPDTLAILDYLADNLAAEQVVCLVTARLGPSSPAHELAERLRTRRAARVLHLSPLARPDVADLVAARLDTAEVPDDVVSFVARAEGIPLHVEQLVAAARAVGVLTEVGNIWRLARPLGTVVPATLADSVRIRLRDLSPGTRDVVTAAAGLGRFDWQLLATITGFPVRDVFAALHEAVDSDLVVFDSAGALRFRHALIRDAVINQLFPPERAALSRRALAAVEAEHPGLDGEWCEVAADLASRSGDVQRAADLLARVAARALGDGALATAEATLDRARDLLPDDHDPKRLEIDELLLEVLAAAGKHARAIEVAEPLIGALGDDATRRARVHLHLARAAVAAAHWHEAVRHLEAAEAARPDEHVLAQLAVVRAQVAIRTDPDDACRLAERARRDGVRLHLPEVTCAALELLGRAERTRDLAAAERTFAEMLGVAQTNELTVWRARALHELGAIDMLRGRALNRLDEARELAVASGALATAAVVDVQVAAGLVLRDDPRPALVATQRSAGLARRYGFEQTLASAYALEAYVHARTRRRAEFQRRVDEVLELAGDVPDVQVKVATASALLALVEENRGAARHHLERAVMTAGRTGDVVVVPAVGLLSLVRAVAAQHEAEPALPSDSVHFLAAGFLRYADAVRLGRSGHRERAAELVEQGDALLGDHRWMRQLGHRWVAEAAVRDGWGDPAAWLREALEVFAERDEDRLASACRSLLRKTGAVVPRRRDLRGVPEHLRPLGITAREFEVLELLALGLANKEISNRLYLSSRTVERHVANLAVKAGTRTRSELVAYAARKVR